MSIGMVTTKDFGLLWPIQDCFHCAIGFSLTNTLWQVERIKCGFNFRSPQLSRDGTQGSFHGTCHCGSIIEITLIPGCENDHVINAECRYTPGTGKCNKRYLRQPMREEVAKTLSTTSACVYRADLAKKTMKPGDPEPGTLYTTSVMNKAKHESDMKKYLDPDAFTSLVILKRKIQKLNLHAMGYDPFFLLYWTNYQVHVYRLYAKNCHPTISIDATGSIVQKLTIGNYKTKHIFLYEAVVNCHLGQFPVTQMLSERHDTVTIHMWLERWLQAGVPAPKEVISDSCKALLNAIVRTFSVYKTIEEYADASWKTVPPKCYVRLDVAHFMKMYANFFVKTTNRVRVFYLSTIGQLIMARTVEIAADIVRSILIVAQSESEGNDPRTGEPIPCEIEKNRLQAWIPHNTVWTQFNPEIKKPKKSKKGTTSEKENEVDIEDDEEDDDDEEDHGEEVDDEEAEEIANARNPTLFDDTVTENSWKKWGNDLNEQAKRKCKIEGDRDNAHYMPKLANRLLKDIRWLPLWSCILRDKYGYGRVPASSSPSESDFNYVKTHLLKKRKPIRIDAFVELQIANIEGRMIIADSKTIDASTDINDGIDTASKQMIDEQEPDDTISRLETVVNNSIENSTSNTVTSLSKPESRMFTEDVDVLEGDRTDSNGEIVSINSTVDSNSGRAQNGSDDESDCAFHDNYVTTSYEKNETEDKKIQCRIKKNVLKNKTVCQLCQTVVPTTSNSDKNVESRHLCETCIKMDVERILASREEEDWGGKTSQEKQKIETLERTEKKEIKRNPTKRCSKYLEPNQRVLDTAACEKSKQIPLLKNGGNMLLKGIKIEGIDVTLINTCAFDSIIQVLLVIMFDEPTAAETFKQLTAPVTKLALHIRDHGLTSHTYKQRAIIMLNWYKKTGRMKQYSEKYKKKELKSLCVNCDSSAAGLTQWLFSDIPSMYEVSRCEAGCTNKEKKLVTLTLKPRMLTEPGFENVLINDIALSQKHCLKEGGCKKAVVTSFSQIGNFVAFELFDNESDLAQNILTLGEIPKTILDPLGGKPLKLKGVINYYPAGRARRKAEINYDLTGHYTAFCLRSTGIWMEYDDMTVEPKVWTDTHKVDIHVIIYFRP